MRAAAQTFRANPEIETERAIQELQVGEALVSVLHNKGEPSMVQRTLVRPPMSRVGPLKDDERRALIAANTAFESKYRNVLDRESAQERLKARHSVAGQFKEQVVDRFKGLFVSSKS